VPGPDERRLPAGITILVDPHPHYSGALLLQTRIRCSNGRARYLVPRRTSASTPRSRAAARARLTTRLHVFATNRPE
jgi:hypothetical protein